MCKCRVYGLRYNTKWQRYLKNEVVNVSSKGRYNTAIELKQNALNKLKFANKFKEISNIIQINFATFFVYLFFGGYSLAVVVLQS